MNTVRKARAHRLGAMGQRSRVDGRFDASPEKPLRNLPNGDPMSTYADVLDERDRLRLAIERIFRDRRESDKVAAECMAVMPELAHTANR